MIKLLTGVFGNIFGQHFGFSPHCYYNFDFDENDFRNLEQFAFSLIFDLNQTSRGQTILNSASRAKWRFNH